jgi:hypothetical protein
MKLILISHTIILNTNVISEANWGIFCLA